MRILVCGGRAFLDAAKVFDVLDELHRRIRITEIIQGGAAGTDAIARDWAESRGVKLRTYIAGKKPTGRSSWSKGNQLMIGEGNPCLVVAFPGVKRTDDMIRRAKSAGITVLEIHR